MFFLFFEYGEYLDEVLISKTSDSVVCVKPVNAFGNYYLPVVYIAHAIGRTFEGASEALRKVCQSGFCSYDHTSGVVWVHEMAKFQIAQELKPADKRVKWVNDEYHRLPKCPFLYNIYLKYKDAFQLEKPRGIEGASKPHRSQEQEQEQDKRTTSSGGGHIGDQPSAPSVISFKKIPSKHFRNRLENILVEIRQACQPIQALPVKEKAFNPFQAVQKAVNEGKHPDAILSVLRQMADEWDSGKLRIPWAWWSAVLTKNSRNLWEKENAVQAESFKQAIADLAKQKDFLSAFGLTIKTIPAPGSKRSGSVCRAG